METVTSRQREILFILQDHPQGLSIPKLEECLGISRTAVNQHLINLERDGMVAKGNIEKTGGRPGYVYLITAKGIDRLPKQYSWLSELMLDSLKEKLGADGLKDLLRGLATGVGQQVRSRLWGKPLKEKIEEINVIMNDLGYEARVLPSTNGELPMISAHNCVYHRLAEKHPDFCQFDLALLEGFLENQDATQEECIVRGGNSCRFSFHSSSSQKPS
ncbi:MAG: HTH domain-containing protein [Nitrospirales bacterium]|nr:HTH domain-containing protein [Nitrospirales bacterium]